MQHNKTRIAKVTDASLQFLSSCLLLKDTFVSFWLQIVEMKNRILTRNFFWSLMYGDVEYCRKSFSTTTLTADLYRNFENYIVSQNLLGYCVNYNHIIVYRRNNKANMNFCFFQDWWRELFKNYPASSSCKMLVVLFIKLGISFHSGQEVLNIIVEPSLVTSLMLQRWTNTYIK